MNNLFDFTGYELVDACACVVRHCLVFVASEHGVQDFTFRMYSRRQTASEKSDRLPRTQPPFSNIEDIQPGNNLSLVIKCQLTFFLYTLHILFLCLFLCSIYFYAYSLSSKRTQKTSVPCH